MMSFYKALKCLIISKVDGDNNDVRNENKYDIPSVDMSKDGAKKCSKWSYFGFKIFKILILTIIMLSLAY